MKSPLRVALIIAALIVAAVIALAYAAYRRDIDRAFERIATGSQIVQTPCGPITMSISRKSMSGKAASRPA